jgi:hypothetical protein
VLEDFECPEQVLLLRDTAYETDIQTIRRFTPRLYLLAQCIKVADLNDRWTL